ncbi:MAG: J domain-containing protein [Spirochaetales bacterium]|nr:J domain-containing protein [Spirochaetales bacterium]
MFRIDELITEDELNLRFRSLVKKYHPDKLRKHPEWAHERMSEINGAYEILLDWVQAPPPPSIEIPLDEGDEPLKTSQPTPRAEHSQESPPPLTPPPPVELELFQACWRMFMEGLGLYFQYGLENPEYRHEGIRRFRFREAYRTIEKARLAIKELEDGHPILASGARFIRLSQADILLGETTFPPPRSPFDRRFRNARRRFDEGVKDVFFPELFPSHLQGRASAGLGTCYAEFVLFLTVAEDAERKKAAILTTSRYDALLELLNYQHDGRVTLPR